MIPVPSSNGRPVCIGLASRARPDRHVTGRGSEGIPGGSPVCAFYGVCRRCDPGRPTPCQSVRAHERERNPHARIRWSGTDGLSQAYAHRAVAYADLGLMVLSAPKGSNRVQNTVRARRERRAIPSPDTERERRLSADGEAPGGAQRLMGGDIGRDRQRPSRHSHRRQAAATSRRWAQARLHAEEKADRAAATHLGAGREAA